MEVKTYKPENGIAAGEQYKLFDITFPADGKYTDVYTITYTVTVKDDDGLTGTRALINTGWIGNNSSSSTTTTTDYGESTIDKKWSSFDKEHDEIEWKITVTIPENKELKNVVIHEHDFAGGESEWWQGDLQTIDWSTLKVTNLGGTQEYTGTSYTVDETGNTITFPTLSESVVITLKTKLTEGMHFANLDTYYVKNSADLTINGEDSGTSTDKHKYEKAEYSFTKEGVFDAESQTATWTIKLNEEGHLLDPDIIPYFADTIPDGMELVGDAIRISCDGHGNMNRYGNQIWNPSVNYAYTTSDNQIGLINLAEAVRGDWDEVYAPTGLSGMSYTIVYQTKITDAQAAMMQEKVDKYTFTNKARITNEQGKTIKSASDTVEYEYKGLIKKEDISEKDTSGNISTIKYKVTVNKNKLKINNGNPLELYDILSTDMTLIPDKVKVYDGAAYDEAEKNGTMDSLTALYPVAESGNEIRVGYEDNTRKLQVFVPDQHYYVVVFEVKPNAGEKTYTNTVVLKAERFSTTDEVEKKHTVSTEGTLVGTVGSITLHKMDQYDITKNLSGAEFELHELTLDGDGKIIRDERIINSELENTETDDAKYQYTTNDKGIATFAVSKENTVYYWKEVKAPDGYMLTDDTPHYFVIYKEYTLQDITEKQEGETRSDPRLTSYKLSDITDHTLKEQIKTELHLEDAYEGTFNPTQLITAEIKQLFIEYVNKQSRENAKNLDHKAQDANGITVATIVDGYEWNWRNVEQTAYAQLKGQKTMIGRNMAEGEFAFELYDTTDPANPIWLQTVKNNVGTAVAGKENTYASGFEFNKIAYVEPGVYTYLIKETYGVTKDSSVVYDTSEYEVEVTVTSGDIANKNQPISEEQIVYKKNGQVVNQAYFTNKKDEASLTISKTFSGAYTQTADFETSGVKNRISFTIRNEKNTFYKEIRYADMVAGTITLTAADGIESNQTYIIQEQYADIDGVVRTTKYTVDSVTMPALQDQAKVTTKDNKAAEVSFDNEYEPETMNIAVVKQWYTLQKTTENGTEKQTANLVDAPDNVKEVYVCLQRYIGSESEIENPGYQNKAENWAYLDKNYNELTFVEGTEENAKAIASHHYVIKASMGWSLEIENLPIGRYRFVEVEKNKGSWQIVNIGNVRYTVGLKSEDEILNSAPDSANNNNIDNQSEVFGRGVTEKDTEPIFVYNRLYDIDFTKTWKNKDEQDSTAATEGVKSVTLQLQSATLLKEDKTTNEQTFSDWTDVAGQTYILQGDETVAKFEGVTRKNEAGQNLYYRVIETRIEFTNGTVLEGQEQISQRFNLEHKPVGQKENGEQSTTKFNTYMKPGDGEQYSHQQIVNIAKPFGLEVTKQWEITKEDENPSDVHVKIQIDTGYGFFDINDSSIKDDNDSTPNEKGIYTIRYENDAYVPLHFSYLFMKDTNGKLLEKPTYNNAEVKAVRIVELKEVEGNWIEYGDDAHAVEYTFQANDSDNGVDVRNTGVDPQTNGTYTITNKERKQTVLNVTKSWDNKPEGIDKIYFKVIAISETGTEQALYKDMVHVTVNNASVPGTNNTVFCLNYANDAWDMARFTIEGKKLYFGWEQLYAHGFYVIETDENGTPKTDSSDLVISYDYVGESESPAISAVSSANPAPAGQTGTLTITNGASAKYIQPKVTKNWKFNNQEVAWPEAVSKVEVQLWRKAGEEAYAEQVGEPIVLTKSNSTYTWEKQEREYAEGRAYTYYVEEVAVTVRQNGELQTVKGDGLIAWFIGSGISEDNPYTVIVASENSIENTATITNKAPEEETTKIRVTKAWVDENGAIKPYEEGQKITFRIMATNGTGADAVIYSGLTPARITNLTGKGEISADSKSVILTSGADGWPEAEITLPKYLDGEVAGYYVEELSAAEKDGKAATYTVSYTLNGEPRADAASCVTANGQITIVNKQSSKYIEVEKLWDDTHSHALETVEVQLYQWTDGTSGIVSPDGTYGSSEESGSKDIGSGDSSITALNGTGTLKLHVQDSSLVPGLGGNLYFVSYKNGNWYNQIDILIDTNLSDGGSTSSKDITLMDQDTPLVYKFTGNNIYNWNAEGYSVVVVDSATGHILSATDQDTVTLTDEGFSVDVYVGTASWFSEQMAALSTGSEESTNKDGKLTLGTVPIGGTPIGNPVTLNSGKIGWSYRWEGLDEIDSNGNVYHYAVVETKLGNTTAIKNNVTYEYVYSDGTTSVGEIDAAKDIVKVKVTNKPTYPITRTANLKIVKVDSRNQATRLTGAEFAFEVLKNGVYVNFDINKTTYSVDEDGVIEIAGLTAGSYRLRETKAPDGYNSLDSDVYINLSDRGVLSYSGPNLITYQSGVLTVGNTPGYELPKTGGRGTVAIYALGAFLVLTGGVFLMRRRRRSETNQ